MTDRKSMLCVGGPRDGVRYTALYGTGFRVPILDDVTTISAAPKHRDLEKTVKIKFVEYREETFHTPQGYVSFWVPNGQTPLETITMLLETYERAKPSPMPQIGSLPESPALL